MRSDLKVVRASEEIEALRADWTSLSIFPEQNWDLYWNQIRHHTPPPSPYVVALLHDDRLQAAFAGRLESSSVTLQLGYWKLIRIPVRRIVIPPRGLLGGNDEATSKGMIERVIEDLREGLADVAVFEFIEEGSPFHCAVTSIPLSVRMRDRVPERRIHRYLSLPATFEEYFQGHKGLVAKVKKFEKAFRDRYECRLLTREDEIDGFCDGAEGVARTTYQRALGVGFLNNAEDRGQLKAAARQGVWRAFVILIDGKTAAFWSGCQFGATFVVWWTAYDLAFQAYSPGLVASTRMVEALLSHGVSVVDFGGGDAPYKERLGTEFRWEESVCVFAPSLRGSLANGVRALDIAVSNLTRTKLKGVANWAKTPWRRMLARRMSRLDAVAPPKGRSAGE